jgi:hypothetical protein
MIKMDNDHSR